MQIDISRFVDRKTVKFSVEVLTPMFLGGADGNAELRVAPFKNALRYWWRIVKGDLPHKDLLVQEQKLFGGVLDNDACNLKTTRSLVDIDVTGSVRIGKIYEMDDLDRKVNSEAGGRRVPLTSYLGMGPVDFNGKYTKKRILPGECFSLTVTYPNDKKKEIIDAMSLFAAFGSIGARSRNGWGSFTLSVKEKDTASLLSRETLFNKFGESFNNIMKKDKKYPFKLGLTKSNETEENQPLLWKIASKNTWENAMQSAGENYMDLRQSLPLAFPSDIKERHILCYPITNHNKIDSWGGQNGRMPSQLRIIIRINTDKYNAYFLHLPHKIPLKWNKALGSELNVWKKIHTYLDTNCTRVTL